MVLAMTEEQAIETKLLEFRNHHRIYLFLSKSGPADG